MLSVFYYFYSLLTLFILIILLIICNNKFWTSTSIGIGKCFHSVRRLFI